MAIVKFTIKEIEEMNDNTDTTRLRNMKDKDIIYDDDAPELSEDKLKQFHHIRQSKTKQSLATVIEQD